MIKRIYKAILRRLKGQSSADAHRELADATPEEWAQLRAACSETYAYITRREDV